MFVILNLRFYFKIINKGILAESFPDKTVLYYIKQVFQKLKILQETKNEVNDLKNLLVNKNNQKGSCDIIELSRLILMEFETNVSFDI